MLKSDIIWSPSRRFKSKSEWEPAGFFSECLCNSSTFDLMLGFFSSSAISVLSDGFATFLHNGGRMRLIINDILTDDDKKAFESGLSNISIPAFDLSDIEKLKETLSDRDKHFFECIAWLIRNERIEIKIIAPIDGVGIAHTKCGVFKDGASKVAFDGSVNFSRTALVENKESLTASCSWDGPTELAKISDIESDFNATFNGVDDTVKYVDISDVKTRITNSFQDKDITQLLEDEYKLIENKDLGQMPITVQLALTKAKQKVQDAIQKRSAKKSSKDDEREPHFPFKSGAREYQRIAFENWKANNQRGLFAMATGTGKTITSLNVLLEIYNRLKYYKAIILVPTITLVEQWAKECKKFNFTNIVKVCSKNSKWKEEIDGIKLAEQIKSGKEPSYIIICTYASFAKDSIFTDLNDLPKKQVLLIADEAHNMGSGGIRRKINAINYLRRIGLSATPERQFDEAGNKALYSFFGAEEKFTYEYSMEEAIKNGVLCKYKYYPHVVRLTDEEMIHYMDISAKLAKVYNYANDSFPMSDDIVKSLLLKRKRIIHKAQNKQEIFKRIIEDRLTLKGNLKYTLVYVPEGNAPDTYDADYFDTRESIASDDLSIHLIDDYTSIIKNAGETVTVRQFTSNSSERDKMLNEFATGELEVLTSMKCLDEGVDVPRSELAIFCASTGNPRQFIQRRGRILRTHPDKHMAVIHDLVVIPEVVDSENSYEMEKRLLEGELKRVRNFAQLSENMSDTVLELDDVLKYYNLSIF